MGTHVHMESHKSHAGYRITHTAYMESIEKTTRDRHVGVRDQTELTSNLDKYP